MTKHECAIVMAYTGYNMLSGDLSIFYEYIAQIMGREVNTIELAWESTWIELHEKSKEDFMKLCEEAKEDD